jgi:hypothetical protein
VLDQHIESGGHGGMSVSDLDEVLQMETFLFGIGRFKCLRLLRGPIWGFLDLERRHEV